MAVAFHFRQRLTPERTTTSSLVAIQRARSTPDELLDRVGTDMNGREVMERVVAAFNTGDLSEIDSLFSGTYIDHQRPPWIEHDGPEEFKNIVMDARRSLPNLRVTIEDLITTDTAVAGRLVWHSVTSDGRSVRRETIEILHFKGGLIVEHWGAESWRRESEDDPGASW